MLVQLRQRLSEGESGNVLCILGGDRDLPTLVTALGEASLDAVTIANALHWMDAPAVFSSCHRLIRPGGGIAVITHGTPLWLVDQDWTSDLGAYLESWMGPASSNCDTDQRTLYRRRDQLFQAGFDRVGVLEDHYRVSVDADYVIGHLYSALPQNKVPPEKQTSFEQGVRDTLQPYGSELLEDVPIIFLLGHR